MQENVIEVDELVIGAEKSGVGGRITENALGIRTVHVRRARDQEVKIRPRDVDMKHEPRPEKSGMRKLRRSINFV